VLGAHFLVGLLKQHSELRLTDFATAVSDAAAFDTPAGKSLLLSLLPYIKCCGKINSASPILPWNLEDPGRKTCKHRLYL